MRKYALGKSTEYKHKTNPTGREWLFRATKRAESHLVLVLTAQ